MTRHKMSLDVGYVSDWGVSEALRELFQNAIDYGDWSYIIDGDHLSIMSHGINNLASKIICLLYLPIYILYNLLYISEDLWVVLTGEVEYLLKKLGLGLKRNVVNF